MEEEWEDEFFYVGMRLTKLTIQNEATEFE